LIEPDTGKELNELIKKFGADSTGFPTNLTADTKTKAVNVLHEHIGEAVPKVPGKSCAHPFLVPDIAEEKCILPQRIDVGRHYVLTGGPEAIREPHESMVNRVSSFGRYMFNLKEYSVAEKLF
jgi:hypothetical protein